MPTKTKIQTVNIPSVEELYRAKVYFGHKKEWSHPAARSFLFGVRQGIYLINLEETEKKLVEAIEYLKKTIDGDKTILFVGTKMQAKEIIEKTAKELKMPYINFRWLGGVLTNFKTIRKNLEKMNSLEEKKKSSVYEAYTKKEKLLIERESERLHQLFDGIVGMEKLPDLLFIVDTKEEKTAVKEAKRLEIPIIGICDANCNPNDLEIAIPANDDSVASVELIMNTIVNNLKN